MRIGMRTLLRSPTRFKLRRCGLHQISKQAFVLAVRSRLDQHQFAGRSPNPLARKPAGQEWSSKRSHAAAIPDQSGSDWHSRPGTAKSPGVMVYRRREVESQRCDSPQIDPQA